MTQTLPSCQLGSGQKPHSIILGASYFFPTMDNDNPQYTSVYVDSIIPYLLGIYGLYAAKNCCPIPGSDSTSVCRKSCSSETRRAHTSLCYKFLMGISLVTGLKMIQLWLIMLLVVNNGD